MKRSPADGSPITAAARRRWTQFHAEVTACRACPRLVRYMAEVEQNKRREFAEQTYWSRPVPSFGDADARVLIVGLAPAAHGSNRTGRMFTGDGKSEHGASEFLARALHAEGLAAIPTSQSADDGQHLQGVVMTAICRCAPPANKPTAEEIARCGGFLGRELDLLPNLRTVLVLGGLAWNQMLRIFTARGVAVPKPRPKFGHGAELELGAGGEPGAGVPRLVGSYHPSRQNTQTGRLTAEMLRTVLRRAASI